MPQLRGSSNRSALITSTAVLLLSRTQRRAVAFLTFHAWVVVVGPRPLEALFVVLFCCAHRADLPLTGNGFQLHCTASLHMKTHPSKTIVSGIVFCFARMTLGTLQRDPQCLSYCMRVPLRRTSSSLSCSIANPRAVQQGNIRGKPCCFQSHVLLYYSLKIKRLRYGCPAVSETN